MGINGRIIISTVSVAFILEDNSLKTDYMVWKVNAHFLYQRTHNLLLSSSEFRIFIQSVIIIGTLWMSGQPIDR